MYLYEGFSVWNTLRGWGYTLSISNETYVASQTSVNDGAHSLFHLFCSQRFRILPPESGSWDRYTGLSCFQASNSRYPTAFLKPAKTNRSRNLNWKFICRGHGKENTIHAVYNLSKPSGNPPSSLILKTKYLEALLFPTVLSPSPTSVKPHLLQEHPPTPVLSTFLINIFSLKLFSEDQTYLDAHPPFTGVSQTEIIIFPYLPTAKPISLKFPILAYGMARATHPSLICVTLWSTQSGRAVTSASVTTPWSASSSPYPLQGAAKC